MQLLGKVQGNTSNDQWSGCNRSRLWHDLSQFSVCSSARGKLPHSWGSRGRESNVWHPSTEPGMWLPGIRQIYSCLSTGKAHARLDKPPGDCMLNLLPERRKASSWPLQFLFSDRPCAWCAAAHLFVCWKKSDGHFFGRSQMATSFTVRGW